MVSGIKQTIEHLTESKINDSSHLGCLCLSTACSCSPANTGI